MSALLLLLLYALLLGLCIAAGAWLDAALGRGAYEAGEIELEIEHHFGR